jgi:hypothetical protein
LYKEIKLLLFGQVVQFVGMVVILFYLSCLPGVLPEFPHEVLLGLLFFLLEVLLLFLFSRAFLCPQ